MNSKKETIKFSLREHHGSPNLVRGLGALELFHNRQRKLKGRARSAASDQTVILVLHHNRLANVVVLVGKVTLELAADAWVGGDLGAFGHVRGLEDRGTRTHGGKQGLFVVRLDPLVHEGRGNHGLGARTAAGNNQDVEDFGRQFVVGDGGHRE